MNMTCTQAKDLLAKLVESCKNAKNEVIFCPPFLSLEVALKNAGNSLHIGAQNVHFENAGAFTGEISAQMLVDIGVEYVIIGHSERREYFAETDEIINKKVINALSNGLKVILCCGENLQQREQGVTVDFIRQQIKSALYGVSKDNMQNVIIAYEPIWAIGTGKVATAAQAQEICKAVRQTVEDIYGSEVSEKLTIQYGGSVNGSNAKELFEQPDIDGSLVGGASLKEDFINIVNAMN